MDLLLPGDLMFMILAFLAFLWFLALVSILSNRFEGPNDKLIWIIVVIFVPFLGALLYWAIGRNRIIKNH
jgi:hypothetical protein